MIPRLGGLTGDGAARLPELAARDATLTPRQVEVARLIAAEFRGMEIARELVVSEATLRSHVQNMLLRTGCRHLQGLAVWVYAHEGCCLEVTQSLEIHAR